VDDIATVVAMLVAGLKEYDASKLPVNVALPAVRNVEPFGPVYNPSKATVHFPAGGSSHLKPRPESAAPFVSVSGWPLAYVRVAS
jgi:hypothetical protein